MSIVPTKQSRSLAKMARTMAIRFDPLEVTSSNRTQAGRYVVTSGYIGKPKEEYTYSYLREINPNHTEDVIVKKVSHNLYDGGLWNAPTDELDIVNAKRAEDLARGQFCSITTQRTLFYKLFVDVDPKFVVGMTRAERIEILQNLGRIFQEVLRYVYPEVGKGEQETGFYMIATSAAQDPDIVTATEETEEYMKMGTHFHFPNVIVSSHEARLIRELVISRCYERGFGAKLFVNSLEDVIDDVVYKTAGLRPVFAPKFKKCPSAPPRNKNSFCNCGRCDPVAGGYYDKPPHELLFVINGVGAPDKSRHIHFLNSPIDLISESEIRSDATEASPFFILPSGSPKYAVNSPGYKKVANGRHTIRYKFKEDSNAMSAMRGTKEYLNQDDPRLEVLQDAVHQFSSKYSRVRVRAAFTFAKQDLYIVNVDGEGSHYCGNLKAPKLEHHSNTVYFCVRASGITQKCFCRCNVTTDRLTGLCKNYQSDKKPLKTKQLMVLFPEAAASAATCSSESKSKSLSIGDMQKRLMKSVAGRQLPRSSGLRSRVESKLKKMERVANQMKVLRQVIDSSAAAGMTLRERGELYTRSKK